MDQQHLPEHALACFAALAYGTKGTSLAGRWMSVDRTKAEEAFCGLQGKLLTYSRTHRITELGVYARCARSDSICAEPKEDCMPKATSARLCVPKTLNPGVLVVKSAKEGV